MNACNLANDDIGNGFLTSIGQLDNRFNIYMSKHGTNIHTSGLSVNDGTLTYPGDPREWLHLNTKGEVNMIKDVELSVNGNNAVKIIK